jgi:hypothetical protein
MFLKNISNSLFSLYKSTISTTENVIHKPYKQYMAIIICSIVILQKIKGVLLSTYLVSELRYLQYI